MGTTDDNNKTRIGNYVSNFVEVWRNLNSLQVQTDLLQAYTESDKRLQINAVLQLLTSLDERVNEMTSAEMTEQMGKRLKRRSAKNACRKRQRSRIKEFLRKPDTGSMHAQYLAELSRNETNARQIKKNQFNLTVTQMRKLRKIAKTFEYLKAVRKLCTVHYGAGATAIEKQDSSATNLVSNDLENLEMRLKSLRNHCIDKTNFIPQHLLSKSTSVIATSTLFHVLFGFPDGVDPAVSTLDTTSDILVLRLQWDQYVTSPNDQDAEAVPGLFVLPPDRPVSAWAKYADFSS